MNWEYKAGLGMLTVALVVSGCSDDSAANQSTTGSTTTSATAMAPAGGAGVGVAQAQQALQAAAQAVPNGRAFDAELETDDGQRVFDVKVASGGNEIKVVVDSDGRRVISQNQAGKPSDDVAKVEGAQVDAGRALQAAAEHEPGTTFSEMEIDTNRDGALVWQIELRRADGSEVEVDVDARSGSVVASR
ncbi:PepSY domain-containing protein [Mycobacterium sp. 21AC1]|uniref:PepSY domain-containing protein n=1 Tax=[Mycobacterium] appelbergii TaxID=2939269 RepID=UPI00293940A1|nr:PepSY domain-containing protein [Mycobacterium sp. 21AC1]MDV3126857.1 PepSY domain-containing protein [Mycobacterium sp. 21AC1]